MHQNQRFHSSDKKEEHLNASEPALSDWYANVQGFHT